METYQADAPGNSSRKRGEDVHGWVQPLGQPFVTTARFVQDLKLVLKDSNDSGLGVARLQLGSKWMSEKVCLGLLLVGLESSLEECLEACGSFGCDCCLGHDGNR